MTWRNSEAGFGLTSRLLHWTMAALILILLPLGLRIESMQPSLSNLWLYGLHKTLGLTVLALAVVRIVWHRISPPPPPIGTPADWQVRAAKLGHLALYALLLAVPLSGWIASSATGLDVLFAERWVLPAIAPVSEAWETTGFAIHGLLTKLLMALLALHIGAALKREMDGDGTLTRMIRGRT